MNVLYYVSSILLITHSFIGESTSTIADEDIKNVHGQIVYQLYDGNKLKVPNHHREKKPSIKLSLHGTTVNAVEQKNTSFWSLNLDDTSRVDFVISELENVTEYSLLWHGAGPNLNRQVCIYYGFNHASWYNAYQSMNASWPMDMSKSIPVQHFNHLFDSQRYRVVDRVQEHHSILEHLFVQSDGFAIHLTEQCPWFIARIPNGDDPIMCFSMNNTFPYAEAPSDLASYLDIKIKFFASKNIRTVTDHVVHRSGLIPKPTMIPSEKIFTYPSWSNLELRIPGTKEEIVKLTENITKFGFPSKGTLILQGWSTDVIESGAFTTDGYPQDSLISSLHSHEIDVGTQIWYPNLVQHELTQKYCIKPTSYCDFSSPDACKLFLSLFLKLKYEKQIDLFHLSAHTELFSKFQLNDTSMQKYPSALATKYVETVFQAGATVMSEFAFKTQHLPVWVRLCNYQNVPFEQLLHELIPSALSVSIAGYSFILPYSAGGFEYEKAGPSEEVFIRMAQAITFMPSVSFSARPWDYSVKAVEIVKKYVNLHIEHAPLIVELAKQRIQDGSPIVRPLWYSAPDDERTYTIGDEYMLGNDILVAPVVKVGQTERTVYFTAGTWIDQHGQSFKGPGEFKVAAPLEELPYFKRKL